MPFSSQGCPANQLLPMPMYSVFISQWTQSFVPSFQYFTLPELLNSDCSCKLTSQCLQNVFWLFSTSNVNLANCCQSNYSYFIPSTGGVHPITYLCIVLHILYPPLVVFTLSLTYVLSFTFYTLHWWCSPYHLPMYCPSHFIPSTGGVHLITYLCIVLHISFPPLVVFTLSLTYVLSFTFHSLHWWCSPYHLPMYCPSHFIPSTGGVHPITYLCIVLHISFPPLVVFTLSLTYVLSFTFHSLHWWCSPYHLPMYCPSHFIPSTGGVHPITYLCIVLHISFPPLVVFTLSLTYVLSFTFHSLHWWCSPYHLPMYCPSHFIPSTGGVHLITYLCIVLHISYPPLVVFTLSLTYVLSFTFYTAHLLQHRNTNIFFTFTTGKIPNSLSIFSTNAELSVTLKPQISEHM